MADLTFDASKITAAELAEFSRAIDLGDFEVASQSLAKSCISCPKEWGKPNNPDTFADLMQPDFMDAVSSFTEAGQEAANDAAVPIVKYSLRNVTARDFGAKFLQPARLGQSKTVAKFFAEIITECPEAWGSPTEVQTYLQLPYYTAFLPLVNHMIRESQNPKHRRR